MQNQRRIEQDELDFFVSTGEFRSYNNRREMAFYRFPNTDKGDQQPSTVVSNISRLVGLYAIFIFVSGWTYFDFYYSSFGVYARWLDLSATEILTKGFIVLFEPGGRWLWLIYLFVLVVPVLFEVVPRLRAHIVTQLVVASLMLACLPLTHLISRSAGLRAAATNQSEETNLPYIRFKTKCGLFSGRLLFVKGQDLYIHDLTQDAAAGSTEVCLALSPQQHGNHFLSIYRLDDVHAVEILERPTGG